MRMYDYGRGATIECAAPGCSSCSCPPAIDLVDLAKAPGEHLTAARLRSSERAGHGRDAAPIL